ncbi:MAG: DUF2325 domain-containing protein [Spongiibacteraceae bacterium]
MCDHEYRTPLSHCAANAINLTPALGSRRRRLWELPSESHCSLIGVCLPIASLRQIIAKALGGKKLIAEDYEVHSGAVSESASRNRLSECLQRALEQRHANSVRKFRSAKSRDAVAMLWQEAIDEGDIAGAFWAALTHAFCDDTLEKKIIRDVHMIQHQAGAHARADMHRLNDLLEENAILGRDLARAQNRSTHLLCEKATQIEQLNAELTRVRALLCHNENELAQARADIERLRSSVPHLESRERLTEKVSHLQTAVEDRDAQLAALRHQLAQRGDLENSRQLELIDITESEATTAPTNIHQQKPLLLEHKKVLCVGGRHASVASYRNIIESYGGDYLHHDGGVEENIARLVTSIAAADLIICQTGCISHDAYWRVKDQCKRTGKQCIYIDNPSPSSLARSLSQVLTVEN